MGAAESFTWIPPAAVPSIGQHVEERALVDRVLVLAQTCCVVLISGFETIIRLVAQFHFKQTRCSFVIRSQVVQQRSARCRK